MWSLQHPALHSFLQDPEHLLPLSLQGRAKGHGWREGQRVGGWVEGWKDTEMKGYGVEGWKNGLSELVSEC